MKKPIILIGGASGTGKSTLANHLSCKLDLDHRLGTGFVRAIVQAETTPENEPFLFSRTSDSTDPIANVRQQSARLKPAVDGCVNRAIQEGTSLVIEGSHLLPEYYYDAKVSLFIVLDATHETRHRERITGQRHLNRQISDKEFAGARIINQYYMKTAKQYGVRVLDYQDNLDEIIKLL